MRWVLLACAGLLLTACNAAPVAENAQAQVAQSDPAPEGIEGPASAQDGDDLLFDVRLNGFDAPERGARCGDVNVYLRAKEELEAIVRDQRVVCEFIDRDDYGRPVGVCSVNGEDVGSLMVSRGWARDWPRYSQRRYAAAEAEAREAGRGIWGLDCPADLWGTRNYD